jgi:hypothetical protein
MPLSRMALFLPTELEGNFPPFFMSIEIESPISARVINPMVRSKSFKNMPCVIKWFDPANINNLLYIYVTILVMKCFSPVSDYPRRAFF